MAAICKIKLFAKKDVVNDVIFVLSKVPYKGLQGRYRIPKDPLLHYWEIGITSQEKSLLSEISTLKLQESSKKDVLLLSYCKAPFQTKEQAISTLEKLLIFTYYSEIQSEDELKELLSSLNSDKVCKKIKEDFSLKVILLG